MVSRDRDRESPADLSPEDMLANPASLGRRVLLAGLVAVVAAPIINWVPIAAWCALYAAVTVVEQRVLGRRGYLGRDLPSLVVTFALSSLYAVAATVLIQSGDSAARFFAVALIGFTAVNILLRLYNSPKLFLAAIAPHAAVLGLVSWGIFARAVEAGEYLRALTPLAVLATYFLLLMPTRKRLAEAWGRLLDAKTAAEQASRSKSEFLATMSHEIRTPLNGILGMAQAMQADALSPEQKQRLSVIRRSGETLLSILNDVLDLSRIEAGKLKIEAEDFDLEHAARGAVATFTPIAEKKGLAFEVSIDASAKGTFRGDSTRLRQILYNLVSNAVKFTEAGGVAVGVSHAGGRLILEVADSGPGIAPDRVEELFGSFVQGDASATRRHGGVGLGLSIVRRLSDLMGGAVEVSSALGRGSIFTVTLPMQRIAEPAPLAVSATATAEPEEACAPIRILAAEDNAVNQLVLKTLLSQAGLEPTVVENGAEAIEAWKAGPWDVILMDIQMPVMDGVTATRRIRAAEAAGDRPKTPIIAVTANAMPQQVCDYEAAGMDMVVPKPLDARRLFEAIERALEACGPHPELKAALA